MGGRSSYDPLTTLFAVRGVSVEGMGLSECDNCDGTNYIDPANGRNRWVAGPPSNQSYVVLRNRRTAQAALDQLLCQPRLADLPSPPAQPPAQSPARPPVQPPPQPPALPSPTVASTNTEASTTVGEGSADSSEHAHKHREKTRDGSFRAPVAWAAADSAATGATPTANLPLAVAVVVGLLLALVVAHHGQECPFGRAPSSAPAPPQGALGGSGQLTTPR